MAIWELFIASFMRIAKFPEELLEQDKTGDTQLLLTIPVIQQKFGHGKLTSIIRSTRCSYVAPYPISKEINLVLLYLAIHRSNQLHSSTIYFSLFF